MDEGNLYELVAFLDAQAEWEEASIQRQFRTLSPVKVNDRWVTGNHITSKCVLTQGGRQQVLLPPNNLYSCIFYFLSYKGC